MRAAKKGCDTCKDLHKRKVREDKTNDPATTTTNQHFIVGVNSISDIGNKNQSVLAQKLNQNYSKEDLLQRIETLEKQVVDLTNENVSLRGKLLLSDEKGALLKEALTELELAKERLFRST